MKKSAFIKAILFFNPYKPNSLGILFMIWFLHITCMHSFCFSNISTVSPLTSIISVNNLSTDGCCFQINYDYDGILGNIDVLETQILTPNVLFSSVEFPLSSGWSYTETFFQRRLRWSHDGGSSIPLGEQTLSDFCFSGWNTSTPVELLVLWREGNNIRQRDTITIECTQCWQAQNPLVTCEADSSYTYTFDYANLSEFRVDYLQIREQTGQDLVVEQNIPLNQSLLPGEIATGLQLHFRQQTVELAELCFEITPRHLLQDTIGVECCTAEYCIPIPICDRCCTDYLIFEEDVNQGFTIDINCETQSVRLQAINLNECDLVRFDLQGVGAGIANGNEAVIFGGLNEDVSYQICMTATRRDLNGENCFEEASIQVCDEFLLDCDDCFSQSNVDYDVDCPSSVDFVCGCDNMTYLNECSAGNWGGITSWTNGCCDLMADIELSVVADIMSNGVLNWSTTSPATIRYFLVQHQSNTLNIWSTIAEVDNTTFTFTDTNVDNPLGNYRIIGVTLAGKILLSEDCMPVSSTEIEVIQGGRLWPNPANEELHFELPFQNQQIFEVWNSTGQRLLQAQTNQQGQAELTTDQWPNGLYYITAYINKSTLWRKPFVINN